MKNKIFMRNNVPDKQKLSSDLVQGQPLVLLLPPSLPCDVCRKNKLISSMKSQKKKKRSRNRDQHLIGSKPNKKESSPNPNDLCNIKNHQTSMDV